MAAASVPTCSVGLHYCNNPIHLYLTSCQMSTRTCNLINDILTNYRLESKRCVCSPHRVIVVQTLEYRIKCDVASMVLLALPLGHFRLPNGKLAHFYLDGKTVADEEQVELDLPPPRPRTLSHALQDGLPVRLIKHHSSGFFCSAGQHNEQTHKQRP